MSTKDLIRDFIATQIMHGNAPGRLADDDPLVESGIIDSLGVMTLLTFLDDSFSIQVSGDDLVPENFDSVSAIAALVERLSIKVCKEG